MSSLVYKEPIANIIFGAANNENFPTAANYSSNNFVDTHFGGETAGATMLATNFSISPGNIAQGEVWDESSTKEQIEYVAHFYIMPFMLFIGLINQLLNIATLTVLPPIGYLYLKASAIADVLSIFFAIPFVIRHGNLHNPYSRKEMLYHAHFELPLFNALATASALCLVAMTIDRYISIRHPIAFFNHVDSRQRTRLRLTIALIFLISFVLMIPSCWQRIIVPKFDAQNRTYWLINRNFDLNQTFSYRCYLVFRELISRLIPIVLIVVLNLFMVRSLALITERNMNRRASQTIEAKIRDNERARISILLTISSCTFVICTLPASLLSLFIDSAGDRIGMQIFRAIANIFEVSHYIYNFYLYALCSVEYRSAFFALIGVKQHASRAVRSSLPTAEQNGRLLAPTNVQRNDGQKHASSGFKMFQRFRFDRLKRTPEVTHDNSKNELMKTSPTTT